MKSLVLVVSLLCASVAMAGPKVASWQPATVLDIQTQDRGTIAAPVAGMVALVPIRCTYYWLEVPQGRYVVTSKHPLDLTIHGHTKVGVDKNMHLHVLDDSGKDRTVNIVRKEAKQAH